MQAHESQPGMSQPPAADHLVVIEHVRRRVKGASLHAISAARQLGGEFALLLLGHKVQGLAESIAVYGANAVFVADDPALSEPMADRNAALIREVADSIGATTVLAASSTYAKDVLPRVAALLDTAMLSDVLAIDHRDGQTVYRRPLYAGSALATVALAGNRRVLSIRGAAFDAPAANAEMCPIEPVEFDAGTLPDGAEFISRESRESDRPELTEARIVVSGGRPLKDRDTFEKLIGALADILGAATGSTRAAVDAGIAPNDWQIGQTGKVIAPELYIAIGVSGAIQHLAGIKDSRTIVAINKDPDAPIFQIATYGIVGDLYRIVPELIETLGRR